MEVEVVVWTVCIHSRTCLISCLVAVDSTTPTLMEAVGDDIYTPSLIFCAQHCNPHSHLL